MPMVDFSLDSDLKWFGVKGTVGIPQAPFSIF